MTTERATIFQTVALGPENTGSGTAGVQAVTTRKLSALGIEPSINVEIQTFRPAGQKYTTVTALGKEWMEASLSGAATYNEIIYPLSSVIDRGTVTAQTFGTMAAGTAYTWVFSTRADGPDNPITFTVEQGNNSNRAARFTYGVVTELGIAFSRDGIELSGNMMARRIADGITMGTTAAQLDLVPVLPTETSVYLATSHTGLTSATAMTRLISVNWTLGNRFGPVWTLNAAESSWAALVETEPNLELSTTVQANSEGMQFLDLARNGQTRFMRVESVGGTIPNTTQPYLMRVDTAFKVSDVGNFSDEDGVYGIEYTLTGVSASSWGGTATVVTVRNELGAL